jgi:hypothetical protein
MAAKLNDGPLGPLFMTKKESVTLAAEMAILCERKLKTRHLPIMSVVCLVGKSVQPAPRPWLHRTP